MDPYPVFFKPHIVEKIWGGRNLASIFPEKNLPDDVQVGESWEISGRRDHDSVVDNGPLKGRTLTQLMKEHQQVFGKRIEGRDTFPLLLKFLDAATKLSVQVHPDDEYARANENDLGKMEAWYILDADSDARIIKGVKEGVTKEDFHRLLQEEKLEECLNMFPVSRGDVVFLPPGALHTIGGGIVLFEVQQNSNVTYRAYDWGRTGTDGTPRELHVDRVLEVADFSLPRHNTEPIDEADPDTGITTLVNCSYFVLDLLEKGSSFNISVPEDCFIAMTAVEGRGVLEYTDALMYYAGMTLLLPAGFKCSVEPSEMSSFLFSYVPPRMQFIEDI